VDLKATTKTPSGVAGSYPFTFYLGIASAVMFFIALLVLAPVLPLYTLHVGSDEAGWGLVVTVQAWASVAFRLLGGPIADRIGRKRVMLIGTLSILLGTICFLLFQTYVWLLIGRFLQGVAIGLFTTAYKALIIDLSPVARRGEAIGFGNMAYGMASLISPIVGEWLLNQYGYGVTFVTALFFALASMGIVVFLPKATHSATQHSVASGARQVLFLRTTQVGIWGVMSVAAIFAAIYTFMPLLADVRSIAGVGMAISIYAIFELLGQRIGGRLGARIGRRLVIAVSLLLSVVGVLLFVMVDTTLVMFVGSAFVGLFGALHRVNLDTIVMEGAPEDLRATAVGFEYAGLDTFVGIINLGLGFVAVGSPYSVVYLLIAAIPAVTIPIMLALVPRRIAHDLQTEQSGP
jgi:MFS family permease